MSTGTAQRVGFVGLGDQGAPIAQRIASNGFPLGVWARRPESLGPFAGTAAFIAPTLQELGAWSDVVGVCVVNDDDVREVVLAPGALLDGMHGGSCLIIHSTVAPATCDELGERAAARGVAMLDAPVSGGAAGASAGTLAVMVGGPAPVLDRVRPVLESFAGLLAHLGPLGAGQRAKIVNNLLFTAILSLSAEAITAGGAMASPSRPCSKCWRPGARAASRCGRRNPAEDPVPSFVGPARPISKRTWRWRAPSSSPARWGRNH